MSKIFCGVGDVPKGKKIGSMKDCTKAGQIRYYGLKKIDKRLVDEYLNKKKSSKKKTNLQNQINELKLDYVGYSGKLRKLDGQLRAEKDKKEKEKISKNIEATEKKLKRILDEINKLNKKKGSGQSRQQAKRKSKKSNTKKKSRRRTK